MERSANMRSYGVNADTDEEWGKRMKVVAAYQARAQERESLISPENGAVRAYNKELEDFIRMRREAEEKRIQGAVSMNRVLKVTAPSNSAPAESMNVIRATPEQINNNQRTTTYVDKRTITINTTASSGPAIASYMRSTNDMMASGVGMAGAM